MLAAEPEVRRELATALTSGSGIGRYVDIQVGRQLHELRAAPRITLGAMKILKMSSLCYLLSVFMLAADYVVACERVTLVPWYVRRAERVMAAVEKTNRDRGSRKSARRLAKMLVEELGRWEDDGGPCR